LPFLKYAATVIALADALFKVGDSLKMSQIAN
jgi:hypothetical protein